MNIVCSIHWFTIHGIHFKYYEIWTHNLFRNFYQIFLLPIIKLSQRILFFKFLFMRQK